jgi:hypothetical protein
MFSSTGNHQSDNDDTANLPSTSDKTVVDLLFYYLPNWVIVIIILLRRFSGKQTVIVPMSDDNAIRFKNATFSIRFFFLIESINPVKVYVFQNGMLLLDEVCDSTFFCFILFIFLI